MRIQNSSRLSWIALICLILGLSSCGRVIQYKPEVKLPNWGYKFSKKFKFESFYDLRPESDFIDEKGFFSYSTVVPNKLNYDGVLAKDLSTAISNGFYATEFTGISNDDNFDFKIIGEISHFYLKEAPTRFSIYSLFTFYGIFLNLIFPAIKEDAKVEIKFKVYLKNNSLIGTYSAIHYNKKKYSALGEMIRSSEDGYYNSKERLNTYLGLAVRGIQSQMIADSLKYR